MGRGSATSDWSDYFSLTWFASNLTLAERCGAGLAQRVKERFGVLVWTTCGSPGESGSIGFILIFQVLPVVILFAAFTSMLYHLRVL